MGEDPSTIRDEIEITRERLGDTVEALAYKADVKARAKESVSDKVEGLKSKVTGAKDSVSGATPDARQVKQGARRAVGVAQENPIGLALGAVAVGFVAGMVVPSTRVEDERLGPVADQVKEQAASTGREVLEHGKQVAQEVAEQARETAKESGREHAGEVQASAQEAAQQTREHVSSST